jgi:proline racemase
VIVPVRTIDAHVGGQPLRLLVDGAAKPTGAAAAQKAQLLRRHADHIRKAVVLEPRGHADMVAAQLTEPSTPGAHAGVVFMGSTGYPAMSGHGIVAVATIATERELIYASDAAGGDVRLVFETGAGAIQARVRVERRAGRPRADSVAFTNVPAFVYAAGLPVSVGGRELRVDVAFGGLFYAIVDTEAVGIPLTGARLPDLRRLAVEISAAVNSSTPVEHPVTSALSGVSGVVFTGAPHDPESHLRTVTVNAGGAVNRSPSGTGMSAVMSVLDAMGLLPETGAFVQEGLIGSLFRGRLIARTVVGERQAISTEIEATAWITGEHTFWLDDDDPLREGLTI